MEDRQLSARRGRRALLAACALALPPLGARAEPAVDAPRAEAPTAADDAPTPGVGAASSGAPPAEGDLNQLHREAAESFYARDGDRDGFVLPAEAEEMTAESFQAADRDRDGKLALVEWVDARFEAIPAEDAPPADARPASQEETAER